MGPGVRINYVELGREMEAKRKAAGLSQVDVSIECGFTVASVWTRLASGLPCHADTFVRVLTWLGTTDFSAFTYHDEKGDSGW